MGALPCFRRALARDIAAEAKHVSRSDDMHETYYELMRRQGISRRSFLKFCSLTAASLGLGDAGAQQIAKAMETKQRTPVIWLHGLECTCCSESFIRSAHPLAKDVVLSMISLDYDDTLMAAAGHQAEEALEQTISKYKGNYILAVEGNPPLADDGIYCIPGGRPFVEKLRHVAKDAKAIVSWGSCASWGCVQAAKPNPTQATPVHKVITDKPIIKVPGCPPIAEVMTGVMAYILTFDRLPDLDAQGRPKMFYSQRVHDKCYRRPHFDAGQFVEKFDDAGARMGYCLYKVGCKGPVTYNACSALRWNDGLSFPIQSGHGCIGCSEDAFWDKGSFYDHLTTIKVPGIAGAEGTADRIGLTVLAAAGAAVAAHAAVSAIKQARSKSSNDKLSEVEK
jgi:hydrogenase small subunit